MQIKIVSYVLLSIEITVIPIFFRFEARELIILISLRHVTFVCGPPPVQSTQSNPAGRPAWGNKLGNCPITLENSNSEEVRTRILYNIDGYHTAIQGFSFLST